MVVLAIGPGTVTVVARAPDRAGLVVYLVSTIWPLRTITDGLDEVIANVTEIVEKSAPVNEVVTTINGQLDAGVDLLEGLLVKKAGLVDAVGLVDGLYPGAAAAGFRNVPRVDVDRGATHLGGLHEGHADAWRAWAARRRSPWRTRPGRRSATSRAAAGRARCSTPPFATTAHAGSCRDRR